MAPGACLNPASMSNCAIQRSNYHLPETEESVPPQDCHTFRKAQAGDSVAPMALLANPLVSRYGEGRTVQRGLSARLAGEIMLGGALPSTTARSQHLRVARLHLATATIGAGRGRERRGRLTAPASSRLGDQRSHSHPVLITTNFMRMRMTQMTHRQ